MTARANITDRAHRYRANALMPAGAKVCQWCGSKTNVVPDHIDGHPDHTTRANLQWLCKSCNTKKGAAFAKLGKGRLTNQYNPAKGVPSFQQYAWAVANHSRGAHDEAGVIIHATPKSKRIEYAKQIAGLKRERGTDSSVPDWARNPGKRKNPAAASAKAFESFHGYEPTERITVKQEVHHHKHLAAAGELVGLQVKTLKGDVRKIEGLGKALLCFNEKMNQLFIRGGDQFLSTAELKKFGADGGHELETLGQIVGVGYFTNKTHLGDEGGEAIYSHKFRTTNEAGRHVTVTIARYPWLNYRVLDQQLEISGGSYTIRAEGIDK